MTISRPTFQDFDELTALWEASVRSTHHFLTEENIQYYKPLVRKQYLPAVDLYIVRNTGRNRIVAFIGLSDELIEMLFVHPDEQGKGYGRLLIDFAVNERHIHRVDVNEQNGQALRFYLNRGFDVVGRDALDATGNPFPILHMAKSMPFLLQLSQRIHLDQVASLVYQIRYNNVRKEELYRLIYHKDPIVSYQALWVCSHLLGAEGKWLQSKQEELIDELLSCTHPGKRRVLLQLLEKQSVPEIPRTDFINFCLHRMTSKQEAPGVRTLCIKLAYKLCHPIPELLQEFQAVLEIAGREQSSPAIASVICKCSALLTDQVKD